MGIVQKINAHYGTNIPYVFKQFDTTAMGYFTTLKSKVDSGECDIISSNATPLPERVAAAHFQCNWGSTSFVRYILPCIYCNLFMNRHT